MLRLLRLLGLCPALAATVTPALAAGVLACVPADYDAISARDHARIAGLEWSRLRGLAAAMVSDNAQDRQTVAGLYADGLAPVGELPEGDYRCRTIKLGGITPLVAYSFFDCSIGTGLDGGYTIVKTTGSQRFLGELTLSGDGYFYRGALHYADETPVEYNGVSERDQVGCLYKVGAEGAGYVLELPSPRFESLHDIIVLLPMRNV